MKLGLDEEIRNLTFLNGIKKNREKIIINRELSENNCKYKKKEVDQKMSQNFETFRKIFNKFNNENSNHESKNLRCINDNLNHEEDSPSDLFFQKFWNSAKKICENPVTNFNISLTNIYNNCVPNETESNESRSTTVTNRSIKTKQSYSNYNTCGSDKHFTQSKENIGIYKQAAKHLYKVNISNKSKNNFNRIQSKIKNFNEQSYHNQCTNDDDDDKNDLIKSNRLRDNDIIKMITKNTKPLISKNNAIHIYRLNSNESTNLSIWQKAAKELYNRKISACNINLLSISKGHRRKKCKKRSIDFKHNNRRETSASTLKSNGSLIEKDCFSNDNNSNFIGCKNNTCCNFVTTDITLSKNNCNNQLFGDYPNKRKNISNFNKVSGVSCGNDKINISKTSFTSSLNSFDCKKIWKKAAKELCSLNFEIPNKENREFRDRFSNFTKNICTTSEEYCSKNETQTENDALKDRKLLRGYLVAEPKMKEISDRNLKKELNKNSNERICLLTDDRIVRRNNDNNKGASKQGILLKENFNNKTINNEETKTDQSVKCQKCRPIKSDKKLLITPTNRISLVDLNTNNSVAKCNKMTDQNDKYCIGKSKIETKDDYSITTERLSKSLPTELNFLNSCNICKKFLSEQQLQHQNAKMNKTKNIHKRPPMKYKQENKMKPLCLVLEHNLGEKKSNDSIKRKNKNEIKEITCSENHVSRPVTGSELTVIERLNTDCNNRNGGISIYNSNYKSNINFSKSHNNFVKNENSVEKDGLELPGRDSNAEVSISNESIPNNDSSIKSRPNSGCSNKTNYLNYNNNMKYNNYYRVTLTCNPALFGSKKKKKQEESTDNLKMNGLNEKLFPTREKNEAQIFRKTQPPIVKKELRKKNKAEKLIKPTKSESDVEEVSEPSDKKEKNKKGGRIREQRRKAAAKKNKKPEDDNPTDNKNDMFDSPEDTLSSKPSSDENKTDTTYSLPSTPERKRSSTSPTPSRSSVASSEPNTCPPQPQPEVSHVKSGDKIPIEQPTNQKDKKLQRKNSKSGSRSSVVSFNDDQSNKKPVTPPGPKPTQPPNKKPVTPPRPKTPPSPPPSKLPTNQIFLRKSPTPVQPPTERFTQIESRASQTESYHYLREHEKMHAKMKHLFCSYCGSSSKCLPLCTRPRNSRNDSRQSSERCSKAQYYSQLVTQLVNSLRLCRSVGHNCNYKSLETPDYNQYLIKPKPCCSKSACTLEKIFCCCRPDCSLKESLKRMFCISFPSKTSSETRTRWFKNKQTRPSRKCYCTKKN